MPRALRAFTIGLTAFLTLVDLFATQAILPSLTSAYGVTPAMMGFAVNACTIGMAAGGLLVALFGRSIDRRLGILASLAFLSLPTLALATMPALAWFTLLRVVQGFCMSSAFALTLAYLGEHTSAQDTASGARWLMSVWRIGGARSTVNQISTAPHRLSAAKTQKLAERPRWSTTPAASRRPNRLEATLPVT